MHPELKGKSNNEIWSKKAADEKKKTKLNLAVFVKKEVKKATEKASKAATKKRKESEAPTTRCVPSMPRNSTTKTWTTFALILMMRCLSEVEARMGAMK